MALRLSAVVLDVRDLKRAAAFWREALGYHVTSDGAKWVTLSDPKGTGMELGLQPRDDAKPEINHVHLDLAAPDVEAEVQRLEKLGATRAPWPYYAQGATYVVLRDPEGHEFCVVPDS